ncbi:hypothetical protein P775_23345 [Puniceibacterium antarcticum]|uniref:Resolvase/invertase-type recombinase catalytic domain-containing protein n=1 Tax=Puniceibacterium antarcticum TaxID=1206336 RepID=A0A2G8R890_9RHOB|nr:hypothetical protein P775_23345 [Puniceibacterium antarcticum]
MPATSPKITASLPQPQALMKFAGCAEIHEEQAPGGNSTRQALAQIGKGDTLVAVCIDRLARSLLHLFEVVERLDNKDAFFGSLKDLIDKASL